MKKERILEILNDNRLSEVFYNNDPVWIQELNNNTAKIGFLNESFYKDVFIEDLYE